MAAPTTRKLRTRARCDPSAAEDIHVINDSVHVRGRRFIYDEKSLRRALATAGFSNMVRCPLMESRINDLCRLENEARQPPGPRALETMVFEAGKA